MTSNLDVDIIDMWCAIQWTVDLQLAIMHMHSAYIGSRLECWSALHW